MGSRGSEGNEEKAFTCIKMDSKDQGWIWHVKKIPPAVPKRNPVGDPTGVPRRDHIIERTRWNGECRSPTELSRSSRTCSPLFHGYWIKWFLFECWADMIISWTFDLIKALDEQTFAISCETRGVHCISAQPLMGNCLIIWPCPLRDLMRPKYPIYWNYFDNSSGRTCKKLDETMETK